MLIAKARFSPQSQQRLGHRHRYQFGLSTGAGVIEVQAWQGQDPGDGHWGCPLRERWGLAAGQRVSPGWEQHLAFTLTVTTSYEGAAALLRDLGHPADDSTLHALGQRLGRRAQEQTQQRLSQPAIEQEPQRGASRLGILMLDGWQVRQRGPGWGKRKTAKPRVEWHECKTGVFYLQEQAARKKGRGLLTDKVVVSWQGEPLELGRRLHLAACEHGLSRARQKLVVADRGSVDLERGPRPLGRGGGSIGFLSCQRARLGLGGKRCMANGKRPARGWKRNCIHYGTERKRRFWQPSPHSKDGAVSVVKSFDGNKIILPNMPAA